MVYISTDAMRDGVWPYAGDVALHFDPSRARVWDPPFHSPHITLHETDDPDDFMRSSGFGDVDGSVVMVEGKYSEYDGYASYMKSIVMEPGERGTHEAIEEMLEWLGGKDAAAQHEDDRGVFDGQDWEEPVDRQAVIIWHRVYAKMDVDQRERLLQCGYGEVHVVVGDGLLLRRVWDRPDPAYEDDYYVQAWQKEATRRGLEVSDRYPTFFYDTNRGMATIIQAFRDSPLAGQNQM